MTLSVIVPLYNEERTVEPLLLKVLAQTCVSQVLVVDDASTDQSFQIAHRLSLEFSRLEIIRHSENFGKGTALRTALPYTTGEIILIQDADLEYNPSDYRKLIAPIIGNVADVVIGNRLEGRVMGGRSRYLLQGIANHVSTMAANFFIRPPVKDAHCGYKAFRRSVLERISIEESRFGADLELVLKASRLGASIQQANVSYQARSYTEGKKIGWRDAIQSIFVICKYGLMATITSHRLARAHQSAQEHRTDQG
jgi:glycosyltransferase involved in cell wall biosynthesis